MLASRKRPLPLLVACTLFFIVLFYHKARAHRIYQQWSSSSLVESVESHPTKLPANRTLGFGAVVVVSKPDSERRHSLVQAANVTDIDLTIPQQPNWTEGDVYRFRNWQSGAQRGSILAWLGHHNALRWFLDSGLETALILEDDVDWDIRLRSVQIPLAASAARQLLPSKRVANHGRDHAQYWGDHDAWDLLYLGHCGDYFEEVTEEGPTGKVHFNLSSMPHVLYKDETLPDRSNLHPFTQSLFGALQLPAQSRLLHRSKFPLCSFGYAVTRPAAMRLLGELAPPILKANGPRAYDVALLHACNKGSKKPQHTSYAKGHHSAHDHSTLNHSHKPPGLRCWTLNSELFHHMPGRSQIAEIGEVEGVESGVPPVDAAGEAQVESRNETTNIDCGFWSGAFAFDDDDTEDLQYLQEHVGRQGKCLKDDRFQTDETQQKLIH
ncbi:glycosyltransferase family 25 protein [Dothidotthia symphoricarpi CBS 119687]|uniref:Glycosyltransferase family 25 protein n=1 Tax=Dothidotthia symphoricarpi CBS 119687 TaxID=1392245 RepID=A0A6A6A6W3_9PLEO|nr:glycosyltransferase family 25 protein [Dothidotthia symphoricarpi CBS 119687]KAF2126863.1 glycosyltransferase family 25 protein [Dothidotthia symphoricarpi CBS 119687]